MSYAYERLPDPGAGLRLHLNENTAGCSPRVLEAMRRVTAEDAAFYPDYTEAHAACARHLGVSEDRVLLVNRPSKGLLGGMRALPTSDWAEEASIHVPFDGDWRRYGIVTHVFTHFKLSLCLMGIEAKSGCKLPFDGEWWSKSLIKEAGLPTVFAKAAQLVNVLEECDGC